MLYSVDEHVTVIAVHGNESHFYQLVISLSSYKVFGKIYAVDKVCC